MRNGLDRINRKILFIAPSAYPLGGVATWLDYIVPGLREENWDVTLGLVEGKFHDVGVYLDVHPDNKVLRIPCGTGTHEGRIRQLLRTIGAARPDLVVAVNIGAVTEAVDRIRAMSRWTPHLAVTLHAIQADLVNSISAEVVDAVVCTNRLACEMVARTTSMVSDRIYYAPYGVDINPSVGRSEHWGDVLRIAYVGRLERGQKRIEDVKSVVDELEKRRIAYELMIVGGGPEEEWLQLQLSEAVSKGKVRFLGTLSSADLIDKVYGRADALLITSLWETGPIVAWEAMINRVAVVTSNFIGSGLEDSLKPSQNCLMFPIGDTVAAADCLEKLRDKTLYHHLISQGFSLAIHRYSKRTSIEQWNEALNRIVEKPPLPASRRQNNTMPTPAGRLDRFFGDQIGETIRELLGLKYDHSEAGGEWPHANLCSSIDNRAFLKLAESIDRTSERHHVWTSSNECSAIEDCDKSSSLKPSSNPK